MIAVENILRERIKNTRLDRGLSLKEVASAVGVADATVQRWESGDIKTIKQKHIALMAKLFECAPGYLMGWEDEPTPLQQLYIYPILGRIPAGVPISAVEYREGTVEVPKVIVDRYGKNNLFALKIKGDSMDRIVAPDSVGIFLKTEDVENNSLVAVSTNGDDVTLKRYIRMNDFVILKPESSNTEHQIKTYDLTEGGHFKVIGLLVAAIKMFT